MNYGIARSHVPVDCQLCNRQIPIGAEHVVDPAGWHMHRECVEQRDANLAGAVQIVPVAQLPDAELIERATDLLERLFASDDVGDDHIKTLRELIDRYTRSISTDATVMDLEVRARVDVAEAIGKVLREMADKIAPPQLGEPLPDDPLAATV